MMPILWIPISVNYIWKGENKRCHKWIIEYLEQMSLHFKWHNYLCLILLLLFVLNIIIVICAAYYYYCYFSLLLLLLFLLIIIIIICDTFSTFYDNKKDYFWLAQELWKISLGWICQKLSCVSRMRGRVWRRPHRRRRWKAVSMSKSCWERERDLLTELD